MEIRALRSSHEIGRFFKERCRIAQIFRLVNTVVRGHLPLIVSRDWNKMALYPNSPTKETIYGITRKWTITRHPRRARTR